MMMMMMMCEGPSIAVPLCSVARRKSCQQTAAPLK